MVGLLSEGALVGGSCPTPGFEGFEKRLEVEFFPRPSSADPNGKGLRALSRESLDALTRRAECTIVSQLSNGEFDSYVLSESSLFVYPNKVVIKTCGTTHLLRCIPLLLELAGKIGMLSRRCKYSRGTFLFPSAQPDPHRSFDDEVAVLEKSFGTLGGGGKAYVMGDALRAPNWHLYVADADGLSMMEESTYTLEMCMTKLNTTVAKQFFQEGGRTAKGVTKSSGISDLMPKSTIDDFLFEPCGYSMNAVEGSAHSTIHITPEDGFSYASWETEGYNHSHVNMGEMIEKVAGTFQPGRFSVALHVNGVPRTSSKDSWKKGLSVPKGYACVSSTRQLLPYGASIVFHTFESLSSLSAKSHCVLPLPVVEAVPCDIGVAATKTYPSPKGYGVQLTWDTLASHGKEAAAFIAAVAPTLVGGSPAELDEHIKKVVKTLEMEAPFYVVDLAAMLRLFKTWCTNLPQVTPYYAVKCNPDPVVLSLLAALGAGFDVASKEELKAVEKTGVSADRIIFANPMKLPSHIKDAAIKGVELTTFDSEEELYKLKAYHPNVKAVLRLRADDRGARCPLGVKYGVEADECEPLLRMALQLGVNVVGVSFHVGSGAADPQSFVDAIEAAKRVFNLAESLGMQRFTLLDIGGGFTSPGGNGMNFSVAAATIRHALEEYFPENMGVRFIAEPGRYFAEAPFTLATNVFGRRFRANGSSMAAEYWVNDGIYGSMNCLLYDHATLNVRPLPVTSDNENAIAKWPREQLKSTVFGPTCDGLDTLLRDVWLPKLQCGDWLVFPRMGAYTAAAGSGFNGFNISDIKTFYVYSSDSAGLWEGDEMDCSDSLSDSVDTTDCDSDSMPSSSCQSNCSDDDM
eukprot:TRINITY_DN3568_c0_g1_i1.p1 TRINITY_DN3568_c0_g1~~TRINITY_DN3568_c0_g1_i1.p1  ORF type:complete len:857 (-),score=197.68 TRINITY_DN3568_c0_g1_i1:551-3121(-)